jgi:hypothetical protein
MKVNAQKQGEGLGTQRCFPEVLESRHIPLVIVGAHAQGYCSP